MKPTRNQILAACDIPLQANNDFVARVLRDELVSLDSPFIQEYVNTTTTFDEWRIPCRIATKQSGAYPDYIYNHLQVPIEKLTDSHRLIALTWVLNESHPITLVTNFEEANFLCQAIECQLDIWRYETFEYYDKVNKCLKERQHLEKGTLLLCFELAGIPAPKSYDDWREPDGKEVPLRAELMSEPSLGSMTVHFTNGELGLVTSGDRKRAKLIHVKHLKDASVKDIAGFIRTNTKKREESTANKLMASDIASLVSKYAAKKEVQA